MVTTARKCKAKAMSSSNSNCAEAGFLTNCTVGADLVQWVKNSATEVAVEEFKNPLFNPEDPSPLASLTSTWSEQILSNSISALHGNRTHDPSIFTRVWTVSSGEKPV